MVPTAKALWVALVVTATVWCAGEARSQAATDFFAGKQLSVLIGTTAGGGYDLYARVLARHMGRHEPGQPTLIAKNMPGAGGLTLANYLYNRAPADGTEIATVQNGLPFERLFQTLSSEGKNALFDATQFGWIGSITQSAYVTVTWHTAPVKTLADAMTREAVLGASATSSDSYVLAMLANRLLGTKFKVVHGYPGAAEVDLAVENGEVQGEAGKDWSTLTTTRPQWIRDGKINILVQMGMSAHADLGRVPMAIDLAKSAEDRQVMEIVFAKFGMGRMARRLFELDRKAGPRIDLWSRRLDGGCADLDLLLSAARADGGRVHQGLCAAGAKPRDARRALGTLTLSVGCLLRRGTKRKMPR
jgi:tripartite-type tricarboxylate transporter receptor subunit TctC